MANKRIPNIMLNQMRWVGASEKVRIVSKIRVLAENEIGIGFGFGLTTVGNEIHLTFQEMNAYKSKS